MSKRTESAIASAEVRHASKSCSRGRFYAISSTLKSLDLQPLCSFLLTSGRMERRNFSMSHDPMICRIMRSAQPTTPFCFLSYAYPQQRNGFSASMVAAKLSVSPLNYPCTITNFIICMPSASIHITVSISAGLQPKTCLFTPPTRYQMFQLN